MSSNRLPGKVLLPLEGKPVLWHVVERARRIEMVRQVVVATSEEISDDPIVSWCESADVPVYRGPLQDLLSRYTGCANWCEAEVVVRITADCPALDPKTSSAVVKAFLQSGCDYATLAPGFPDGLDTQVFSRAALEIADQEASNQDEREHVGLYIERNPERFRINKLAYMAGMEDHRWTLDYQGDYEFLARIFGHLSSSNPFFGSEEIFELLARDNDLNQKSKENCQDRAGR